MTNQSIEKEWVCIETDPDAEIIEESEEIKAIEEKPKTKKKNTFF